MDLHSKFDINDEIISIQDIQEEYWEPCEACSTTGLITLNNKEAIPCPKCWGREGFNRWHPAKWIITEKLTIGMITARAVKLSSADECLTTIKFEYMTYQTGIESGRILYEDHLFHTEEEAQAECDKLNKEN